MPRPSRLPLLPLLAALLTLLSGLSVHAQTIVIRDADTREPIPWSTVEGRPSGRSAVADELGRVPRDLFADDDSVRVRSVGYTPRAVLLTHPAVGNTVVALERDTRPMNALVVAASRWEQASGTSPSKVVTVDARDIALQNPQTAADLLGASGQVFIQKSQLGGGSPMIRGFATNRVLLVVDGVRMNNAIFRSGNLQNVISIDPLNVEAAEVLFGPGSVRYGSDAIGGVMAFRTEDPRFSAQGAGLTAGASLFVRGALANGEKTGHGALRLSGERWASLTSFTYTDYADQVMGSNGPDDYLRPVYQTVIDGRDTVVDNPDPKRQVASGYRQWNLMQKLRLRLDSAAELSYAFQHGNTGNVPRYDRLVRPRGETLRSAEWTYGPQVWTQHRLGLETRHANGFYDALRTTLAFQRFGESRIDRDLNDPLRTKRFEEVDAFTVNVDARKDLGGGHRLEYGLEGVENWVRSTGLDENIVSGEETAAAARYPDARWSSYAAYAGWGWDAAHNLHLEAGGRYNHIRLDATFDTTLFPLPFDRAQNAYGAATGQAGLVWRPGDWTLRAAGGSAFRAPNVDDVGKIFDSEPGAVVVPNPDLEAEYAWNAELGLARAFGDAVRVDLTAYRTWLQNALVRRDYTLNGMDSIVYDGEPSRVQAIQNAAMARVYGFQAAVEARLPAGFGLVARWNFQEGTEELDDGSTAPLRHAAPWFAQGELTWTGHRWRVALVGQYHAEVAAGDMPPSEVTKDYLYAADADGAPYSPSWYRLDLRFSWQVTDAFRVSGGIENLTDRRYLPYSSGIAGAGFNPTLALRYVL